VVGNRLVKVRAQVDGATGDTLVDGRRYSETYPMTSPPYSRGLPAFDPDSELVVRGTVYVAERGVQAIEPELLVLYTEMDGVPIFRAETPPRSPPEYVFVPVRPGCVFQSFEI
jgi:hypothetical protein